jgi:CRP/FNR family transcriptional regulator, nitrogen oxide reductase regulator
MGTMIKPGVSAFKSVPRGFLAMTDLFKDLPASALQSLEARMVEKKYAKNASIFLEGDAAESVWFVKEGHVKSVINTPNGRCQTLCMMGPKKMFGACCCLGGEKYPCHAVAETDATVVFLPMSDFTALLGRYPGISSALAAHLSRRLRESKDMQAFDQEPVEKRILHILLGLVEDFGNTIPLTRREIAEMAGTTVETSIRTFSRLEEEGLVSTGRGRIAVKDVRSLMARLEED